MCCRSESGAPNKSEDAAGYWGSLGSCDIPVHTADETFKWIYDNLMDDFDFIVFTGDMTAHDIWNQSQESNLSAAKVVFDLLEKYFSTKPLYYGMGNHETNPIEQFDFYDKGAEDWMYNNYSYFMKDWITGEGYKEMKEKLSYSTVIPEK